MQLYTIRPIMSTEFLYIKTVISQINFLEKRSWTKPLSDMVYEGLLRGKWNGIGCFIENSELMSYCDYKIHENGPIEIGVCFTKDQYRGRGLAKLMLQFLITCNPNQEITIGTAECNMNMISCIEQTGFQEETRVPNDRVNGVASIHYKRFPLKHRIL